MVEVVQEMSADDNGESAAKEKKRRLRLQKTQSPLRETMLELPLEYPFQRQNQSWPPFTGLRKELGDSG